MPSSALLPRSASIGTPWRPSTILTDLVVVYDALLLTGLFLVVGVLATAHYSKKVSRNPTWFSFMIGTVIYCFAYLIIIGDQTNSQPGKGVCLLQAAFVHSTPVLTSFAAVAMIIQVYLTVTGYLDMNPHTRTVLLVIIPHIMAAIIFAVTLALGLMRPDKIIRGYSGMFCMVWDSVVNKIFAVIVNALIAVMVIFEALTIIYFFKNRSAMRRASNRTGSSTSSSSSLQSQSLSIALRLTLFTVFPMVALSVSMIASFVGPSYWSREVIAWINLCAAIFPLLVGIIFGSQKDILSVWMFWREDDTQEETTIRSLKLGSQFKSFGSDTHSMRTVTGTGSGPGTPRTPPSGSPWSPYGHTTRMAGGPSSTLSHESANYSEVTLEVRPGPGEKAALLA